MVTGGNTGSGLDSVIFLGKFSHLGMSADVENRPISRVKEMAVHFYSGGWMDAFRIKGPCKLDGELEVPGTATTALPLMAAALLTEEEVVLQDVPAYADVGNLIRLLRSLGAKVTHDDVDNPLGGRCGSVRSRGRPHRAVRDREDHAGQHRRAGPLSRPKTASVSRGGCGIEAGRSTSTLHGLRSLVTKIELDGGRIEATAPADG